MNNIFEGKNKTAFVDVNILSMLNGEILKNQTVLISGETIESIGRDKSINIPVDAFIIDGKGKYLIPGLIDMHVHLGDNEDDLLLFLVNGVTTIRNMWGYENFRLRNWLFGTRVFNHLKLRNDVKKNLVPGPTIFTAGPLVEGETPFFPRFMVKKVTSAQSAEEIVSFQAGQGYDLIKFYSTLSEDVFASLARAAEKNNISIAGHVPDTVGIRNVIDAKVTSIEHLLGFFNPYKPTLTISENEISEIARLSAENNVYHCPTLIASERICNIDRMKEYENEPEMEYVPLRVKKGMKFLLKASSDIFRKKHLKPNHEYLPFLFRIVRELKEHGAGIVLGTDKATPYVVAGFSLHRELSLLIEAGLTPFEAIKTATYNAAKCLKREKTSGTIDAGKCADLVLVEQNPLTNIEIIKNHCGVMTRGRWLSRGKCNQILNDLKQKNKG
jgi:imidazolonepropionase-like amidohydrolase